MKNQMRTVAKVWCAACFAVCAGLGQSETSSLSESPAAVSIPIIAARPLHWVNQHECDGATSVAKRVCIQGDSLCPTGRGDYLPTPAGLNQAITDAENLRVQNNQGTLIQITAGAHIEIVGTTDTILARHSGYSGSQCIVFESSNPLPAGVRVGSVQIASISRNGNTVSVTTSQTHGLKTGDVVEVKNVTGSIQNFNGTFPVTVLGPQRFTYSQAGPVEAGIVTPMFTVATGPNTLVQQRTAHMYTIESTTANTPAILTQPGAHHYVWHDGEVATTNAGAGQGQPLVIFGPDPAAKTFAQNASHIGFDHMYVHGCAGTVPTTIPIWPEPVPCGSAIASLKTGVRLNCSYCWVVNSFFDQMQQSGIDSHALGTYDGQGPFKIVNNHLRGGASTLHFGGTPPSIPGLVPSDIEIRLNTVDLDPNWFSLSHCGLTGSRNWMLSDRLDIRNGSRIVIEGNEFYQAWCDSGSGTIVLMSPIACSFAGCTGGNQSIVSDIYFASNLVAHSYGVFQVLGRSSPHAGGGLSQATRRVDIINNLFWDLGVPGYGSGRVVELGLSSGGQTYSCSATRASNVASATGCACLSTNCPVTGIATGDWVLTSCTDPSFNVSRVPALTSNPNTHGPVTYSNPGPDVPLTAAVGCTLSNSQGWPRKLNYRHNTMVANGVTAGVLFASDGDGPNAFFPRDFTMMDSISSNAAGAATGFGWFCNGRTDGSRSIYSGQCWGISSLNFNHFVAEGRSDSINYSEYVSGQEIYPAQTLFFPRQNACSGTYDATCLGYVGNFATPNPSDYHSFALCDGANASCAGRSFYAGAASDGTDVGVDVGAIDNARLKSQFNSTSYPQ
jgi:hypothetical protein